MMKKSLTFAVLGAGRIGRMHASNLLTMPHVRLKTVLDKHQKTDWLPVGSVVEVTSDLNSILADPEIEAVIIATASSSHVKLIKEIIPTQKHIFSEKPVSFSSKVLGELRDEIAATGIKFQIGYNRRYDPSIMELKQQLQAGAVGKPYIINIKNRDPERPPMNFIPRSGGMLFDFNTHDFDMIHFLSESDIESIYTLGANLIDPEIGKLGDIDTTVMSLKLKNGTLVTIDSSRETGYGYDQELEVFGAKGSIKLQNVREHALLKSHAAHVSIAHPKANFIERYREAYFIQINKFIDWVTSSNSHSLGEISLREGQRAICVAEAAFKSLQSNTPQVVEYPPNS